MSKKIRLTRTMVVEYEPNPEDYPEGLTLEEMANLDAESDDRELLFEECKSDEIVCEVFDTDEENAEKPYLLHSETVIEKIVKYNPNYGDDRKCECGHTYYRHFDSWEDMYPVGCKYCGCGEFKEKKA